MAIRRPSVYRHNEVIFQDFLEYDAGSNGELRYVLAKWDGEPFEKVDQTFDYLGATLKGGPIVSRLDYTRQGTLITVDHWEINWRDEWPLRLSVKCLAYCLYPASSGYTIRVKGEPREFWISEKFEPLTNSPDDFLVFNHGNS